MYTDDLIKKFLNWNTIPERDRKILGSFDRQIRSGNFLTENQSKLFLKIFKENIDNLKLNEMDLELIENPKWSKPFKINQYFKKIYIHPVYKEYFVVEFSYSKRIKDKLYQVIKNNNDFLKESPGKFLITLNEEYLYSVLRAVKSEHFEIDEQLKRFYNEIVTIKQSKHKIYDVFSLTDNKLKELITNEVGNISDDNLLLIDRRFKYQYSINIPEAADTLTKTIAFRENNSIHINRNEVSMDHLFRSLTELNRFPLLLVFDNYAHDQSVKILTNLKNISEKFNFDKNTGIYFRYKQTPNTMEFNTLIGKYGFNSYFDNETKIIGISTKRVPKFMLTNNWYPSTVLSFTNNLKYNAVSVYCNTADLIIFYTEKPPL